MKSCDLICNSHFYEEDEQYNFLREKRPPVLVVKKSKADFKQI